jgi:hypothetical protein
MTITATERTLHGLLVRAIRFALPRQAPAGQFLIAPAINSYKVFYDQQVNAGIGYCLVHRFPGNPYYHHAGAAAAMERSLRYMLDAGGLSRPPLGRGFEHRNLRASVTIARMAGDLLSRRLRAALAESHQACLKSLRVLMRKYRDVTEFDARTLDTGTNHFWGYLAITAILAQHLEDESVLGELRPFAERFARAQDRTGHWTENDGPTSVYTRVSAHFMGLVAEVFPTPALIRAARRAVDFQIDFSFPDGSSIECFDERVQAHESFYGLSQYLFGITAMPHHPRGREYFAFLVRRLKSVCGDRTGFASLEFCHFIVDALQRSGSLRGTSAWKPEDAQAHGDGFGTVRRGPWQVGYQALPTRDWHENPFFLDRQSLFSLWHDRCERAVDGSNSKRQPEIGTFTASRTDGAFFDRAASLPVGGRWRRGRGLGTLTIGYPDFTADLAFVPRGDELVLTVRARALRPRLKRLMMHVRLPFRWGARLRTQSGGACVLGEHAPVELSAPQRGWIESGGVRFSASMPFTATWPYIPFSSYRWPMHQRAPADAWFPVSFDLDPAKPAPFELRWRIERR